MTTRLFGLPLLHQLAWIAIAFAFCALPGCVFNDQPLSDEKTSTVDPRLIGTWNWKTTDSSGKSSEGLLTIARKSENSPVLVATIDNGKGKESTDLFLKKVGDYHLVSLKPIGMPKGLAGEKNQEKLKYAILKYSVTTDDKIDLQFLDLRFFIEAVQRKELNGVAMKGNIVLAAPLTDTPQNICQFIEKYGDKCFTKYPLAKLDIEITRSQKP